MKGRTRGGKLKVFLKVFRGNTDFSNSIVRVVASVVSGDYQVYRKLINVFNVIGMIKCDKRDGGGMNIKFSDGEG